MRSVPVLSFVIILSGVLSTVAVGQMSGSRGGVEQGTADLSGLPLLEPKVAEGYITIDGRAELRLPPTDIRMVLAVTSEAETAARCQQSIDTTVAHLKAAWSKIGIGPEKIVVDFIAILPRYEWTPEKHGNNDVEVEKKVGYRMQTNVHLAAKGDAEAQAALAQALQQGITDIIAFDYWSKDIDEAKANVRKQALKAAREKADVLLGALFKDRPAAINVQERTTVRYPESLYQSFTNVADEAAGGFAGYNRREVPFIKAYRPRNTYYRGLYSDGDLQPRHYR
jgi:uncharacterized protein YggE